jgi:hypothetical protein
MKFIQVDGADGNEFLDLDKVISFSMVLKKTPAGFDIAEVLGAGGGEYPAKREGIVSLMTAAGDYSLKFDDSTAAEKFVEFHFGITYSFDQDA